MKEKDYTVIVFVGKRNAHGKFNGWSIDLTIQAKGEKEAIKTVGDMLASETYPWGKNKQRKKKAKKESQDEQKNPKSEMQIQ